MPFNWSDPETRERLLAAIIASTDKPDCARIAHFFGKGATYHTIENQLRTVKKKAKVLMEEAEGRDPPSKSGTSTPKTPRKKKIGLDDGVKSGRVSKTPVKKIGKSSFNDSPVKKELIFEDENMLGSESVMDGGMEDFEI